MGLENQIYRLTFDVDLPPSIGENEAMTEAESCCETYVLPTVDEVLSRFENYNIDIERVDLDLGKVSKEELPRVLRNLLEEEIVKRLYHGSDDVEEIAIRGHGPIETKSASELDWMSYLYTGVVPWTYEDSERDLAEQVTQEVFSRLDDKDWMASFFGRLSTNDAAFYRFFNLLSSDRIGDLLNAPFFAEALKKEVHDDLTPQKLNSLDKQQLLALSYAMIKVDGQEEEQKIEAIINQGKACKAEKQQQIVAQKEETEEQQQIVAQREEAEEQQQIVVKITDVERLEDRADGFDKMVSSMKQQLLMFDEAFEEHCLVDDAGLVILHPFLPALFERLGYLDEERKFVNLALQERAVHLLRWLAGFEMPHLDYQMPLEKALCDLPLAYPMGSEIEFDDLEKEEGRQVLRSVCQYWKPLNGTSPEGLQRSFLQRHGSIAYEDNAWIVRVEGQALDILLDDLPWEISLLLLPWKEEMIMVEWQRE